MKFLKRQKILYPLLINNNYIFLNVLSLFIMNEYYNFILILYFGFFVIYVLHPTPIIFYRNEKLYGCKVSDKQICIEE